MLPDLAKIKPQILPGVPRLWEALASGIFRSIKKDGGAKKALFAFFVAVGKRYCAFRDLTFGRVARFKSRVRALDFLLGVIPWLLLFPLHALGDALIFRKIRDKLGGRIRVAISGGGALQPEMDDFYRAVGLNLLEGYGITETTPVLSFRDQIKPRSGCVGKVFPDTECKIVEPEALAKAIEDARGMAAGARDESDGREGLGERAEPDVLGRGVRGAWRSPEGLPTGNAGVIMVRGGQVMAGYYKRPDLTARVIDSDGWFNTGDLGMLSRDNEIKITGRAKDTIVLLGGENVEPAPIERAIKGFECVESAVVLGQDKKYLTALIVPARDALLSYAAENDIPTDDYEALLAHPAIVQLFRAAIDSRVSHHAGFRPFEFIFRFALLSEPFQVGRELSGKQEIMRHRINEIYKARIDTLFRD
jgi:long-chain acyl-CoA synthetase